MRKRSHPDMLYMQYTAFTVAGFLLGLLIGRTW